MGKWYELSEEQGLRLAVADHLMGKGLLPPSRDKNETAAAFWERAEKAGLLITALDLYDKFVEEREQWVHMLRETKETFAERIQREGRRAEVEHARNELAAAEFSLREIHVKLVYRFQPLDGSRTRPWETPDPWEKGRLFRKKGDQDRLLAAADSDGDEEDDYDYEARWRDGVGKNASHWRMLVGGRGN
jgi:hypothetical protein